MDIVENRSGSITDALNKLRIADAKITELKTDLANWKIEADIDVYSSGDNIVVGVRIYKDNGDGFSFQMPGDEALKYADDPDTLIQMVAEKIYDLLYRSQIKDAISTKLNVALANLRTRSKGTSL